MGAFVAYTFESGIYLLAGYLIYKLLLSRENQPAFNRFILLAIYAVALTAPLLRLPDFVHLSGAKPATLIELGELSAEISPAAAPVWARICVTVYYIGMAVAALLTLMSLIRLITILRKGELLKRPGYSLIILRDSKVATFSWLHYIVMSRHDYNDAGETILLHERAHLNLLHGLDLLLSQIVIILLWYNPAAWLMRAELRTVHEYQADDAVLKSGANARQYQILLTEKAVGRSFPTLVNSLNHSKLKNRIIMMCNPKSSPVRRLRAVAIVPALLLAAVAVNTPIMASALGAASSVALRGSDVIESNLPAQTQPVAEKAEAPAPEVLPQYPGGQMDMFKFLIDNIKYPEEAVSKGIEGRVVVHFVVNADGSLSDISIDKSVSPELDAEAIRVVSKMPRWTPAKKDGNPVSCSMALPVAFKLPQTAQ